jgi:hypothetical protein
MNTTSEKLSSTPKQTRLSRSAQSWHSSSSGKEVDISMLWRVDTLALRLQMKAA